jgi:hypothetical protein
MQYLDSRKDHPSGTTNEDFYAHVLREMYKLSKGQGDSAAISLIDDNVDSNNGIAESEWESQVTASDAPIKDTAAGVATGDNTEEMFETFPNGRVFKGFSCFVLYGPRAPEAQHSNLCCSNKMTFLGLTRTRKVQVGMLLVKKSWNRRIRSVRLQHWGSRYNNQCSHRCGVCCAARCSQAAK